MRVAESCVAVAAAEETADMSSRAEGPSKNSGKTGPWEGTGILPCHW